jgi:hypothetical protein
VNVPPSAIEPTGRWAVSFVAQELSDTAKPIITTKVILIFSTPPILLPHPNTTYALIASPQTVFAAMLNRGMPYKKILALA